MLVKVTKNLKDWDQCLYMLCMCIIIQPKNRQRSHSFLILYIPVWLGKEISENTVVD